MFAPSSNTSHKNAGTLIFTFECVCEMCMCDIQLSTYICKQFAQRDVDDKTFHSSDPYGF